MESEKKRRVREKKIYGVLQEKFKILIYSRATSKNMEGDAPQGGKDGRKVIKGKDFRVLMNPQSCLTDVQGKSREGGKAGGGNFMGRFSENCIVL